MRKSNNPGNNCKQSNKGLQKFTDFEEIKAADFPKVKEEDPEAWGKLFAWLQGRVNDSTNHPEKEGNNPEKYWDRMEKYLELNGYQEMEALRHDRKQINRTRILQEMHAFVRDSRRLPTKNELMTRTGLSRVTINKHLSEGLGAELYEDSLESFRRLIPNVLSTIYSIGMNQGDVRALRAFLSFFAGGAASPGTRISTQNNYLQVNNTRIDAVTIQHLPEEARLQIEEIIKHHQPINV